MKLYFAILFLFSLNAQARIKVIGNGGDALVCANEVLSLDFWEGKMSGRTYEFGGLTGDYRSRAIQILERLATKSKGPADRLRRELDFVLANIIFLPDIELDNISDSAHPLKPRNCELKQLGAFVESSPVEYRGQIVVDKNLFDAMAPDQQAFFILHEASYRRQILDEKDNSSRRARSALQHLASREFLDLHQVEQWRILGQLGLNEIDYAGLRGFTVPDVDSYNRRQSFLYAHEQGFYSLGSNNKPYFVAVPGRSGFVESFDWLDNEFSHKESVLFPLAIGQSSKFGLLVILENQLQIPAPLAEAGRVTIRSRYTQDSSVRKIEIWENHGERIIKSIFAKELTLSWARDNRGEPTGVPQIDVQWSGESLNYGNLEVTPERFLILDSLVGVGWWWHYLNEFRHGNERRDGPQRGEWAGHEFLAKLLLSLPGSLTDFTEYNSQKTLAVPEGFRDSGSGRHFQGRLMVDPWRHVVRHTFDADAEVEAPLSAVKDPGVKQVLRLRRGQYYTTDERFLLAIKDRCSRLHYEDGTRVKKAAGWDLDEYLKVNGCE